MADPIVGQSNIATKYSIQSNHTKKTENKPQENSLDIQPNENKLLDNKSNENLVRTEIMEKLSNQPKDETSNVTQTQNPQPKIKSDLVTKQTPNDFSGVGRTIEGWLGRIELSDQEFANCEVKVDDPAIALLCKGRLNQKSTNRLMDRIRDQALNGSSEGEIKTAFDVLKKLTGEYTHRRGWIFFDRNTRLCSKLQSYYKGRQDDWAARLGQNPGEFLKAGVRTDMSTLDRLVILEASGALAKNKGDVSEQPVVKLCAEGFANRASEILKQSDGNNLVNEVFDLELNSCLVRLRTDDYVKQLDRGMLQTDQSFKKVELTKDEIDVLFYKHHATKEDVSHQLTDLFNRLNERMCRYHDENDLELFQYIVKNDTHKEVYTYSLKRFYDAATLASKTSGFKTDKENLSLERLLSLPFTAAVIEAQNRLGKMVDAIEATTNQYFGKNGRKYVELAIAKKNELLSIRS